MYCPHLCNTPTQNLNVFFEKKKKYLLKKFSTHHFQNFALRYVQYGELLRSFASPRDLEQHCISQGLVAEKSICELK
jgi:hypothetical protein